MTAGSPPATRLSRAQLLHEMGLSPQWQLREPAWPAAGAVASELPPVLAEQPNAPRAIPPVLPVAPAAALLAPSAASAVILAPADGGRLEEIAGMGWEELQQSVAACRACALCASRRQAVLGVGDAHADWLFIGEGPGAEEDARGEPFVGPAGKLLDAMLAAIDLRRGDDVYIANAVKCRPPNNRTPTAAEIASCAPYLQRQVALLQPRLIVLLGRAAAQALLADSGSLASLRGQSFAAPAGSGRTIPVVVTYHPAYLLRTLPDKAKAWEDLCRARALMRAAKASAAEGAPPPPAPST
ncbi:MAG: uracil-DNA glycosylase [Candidatus Accumulibacter sp. UW20]|jgi:uracil-DNA glycosylase family 4